MVTSRQHCWASTLWRLNYTAIELWDKQFSNQNTTQLIMVFVSKSSASWYIRQPLYCSMNFKKTFQTIPRAMLWEGLESTREFKSTMVWNRWKTSHWPFQYCFWPMHTMLYFQHIFNETPKAFRHRLILFFEHNSLPISMAGTKLILSSQHCPKKKRQLKQFSTDSQTSELHAWSTNLEQVSR